MSQMYQFSQLFVTLHPHAQILNIEERLKLRKAADMCDPSKQNSFALSSIACQELDTAFQRMSFPHSKSISSVRSQYRDTAVKHIRCNPGLKERIQSKVQAHLDNALEAAGRSQQNLAAAERRVLCVPSKTSRAEVRLARKLVNGRDDVVSELKKTLKKI
ncbi:MAG: hypothetical protein Q9159_006778 [Coniocarpon cinnabarinum]